VEKTWLSSPRLQAHLLLGGLESTPRGGWAAQRVFSSCRLNVKELGQSLFCHVQARHPIRTHPVTPRAAGACGAGLPWGGAALRLACALPSADVLGDRSCRHALGCAFISQLFEVLEAGCGCQDFQVSIPGIAQLLMTLVVTSLQPEAFRLLVPAEHQAVKETQSIFLSRPKKTLQRALSCETRVEDSQ